MRFIIAVISLFFITHLHAEVATIPYDKVMTVDGYDLSYTCKGTGTPVTILEPPSGIASEEGFKNIFHQLAKSNKTCIYARLGNGSDNRAEGLDLSGLDYVRQLKELIKLEAKDQPLYLVGYSYGSFVARLYASENPDAVKGLLLIDPPHHEWLQSMKKQMVADDWNKMEGILTWFKSYRGHNVWDTQFEVAKTTLKKDLPVIIVARGQDEVKIKKAGLSEQGFRHFNDIHFSLIEALKSLTENTKIVVAPNSPHLILEHEPEVVINAFKQLKK